MSVCAWVRDVRVRGVHRHKAQNSILRGNLSPSDSDGLRFLLGFELPPHPRNPRLLALPGVAARVAAGASRHVLVESVAM